MAKTILLVDDEFALVDCLSELLRDEGYRVVSAANGKDGLERAKTEKPDLVITDLMMPIANGRTLVKGMQQLEDLRGVPVVMMSASARDVAVADDRAVSAFIRKPFQWDVLLAAVVQLIGPGREE